MKLLQKNGLVVKHILVEGRVQGVSFRYHTIDCANRFGVKGWVRNLPDGRVEIMASAPGMQVMEEFLSAVKQGPPRANVKKMEIQTVAKSSVSFDGFTIRHDGGPAWD